MGGCKKRSLPPLFPREIASRGDRYNCEQIASWLLRYGAALSRYMYMYVMWRTMQ